MNQPDQTSSFFWLLGAAFLSLAACTTTESASEEKAEKRERPSVLVEGEPMYTVLPKDAIPAIDEPVFVSAAEAAEFMSPSETVIGVVGANGTARCYSAWQLDSNEIVNDMLDGHAIAATW